MPGPPQGATDQKVIKEQRHWTPQGAEGGTAAQEDTGAQDLKIHVLKERQEEAEGGSHWTGSTSLEGICRPVCSASS